MIACNQPNSTIALHYANTTNATDTTGATDITGGLACSNTQDWGSIEFSRDAQAAFARAAQKARAAVEEFAAVAAEIGRRKSERNPDRYPARKRKPLFLVGLHLAEWARPQSDPKPIRWAGEIQKPARARSFCWSRSPAVRERIGKPEK